MGMVRRSSPLLILVLIVLAGALYVIMQDLEVPPEEAYDNTVMVLCLESEPPLDSPSGYSAMAGDYSLRSFGTAWFVNREALVTAYHVVDDCGSVVLARGSWMTTAAVKAYSEAYDVAILEPRDPPPAGVEGLPLSYDVRLGDPVYVVGYPIQLYQELEGDIYSVSLQPRLSEGVVSWLNPERPLFEFTAPVDAGNSGGPVVNARTGGVVGIVVYARQGVVSPGFYALRMDYLSAFLDANDVEYRVAGGSRFTLIAVSALAVVLVGLLVAVVRRGGVGGLQALAIPIAVGIALAGAPAITAQAASDQIALEAVTEDTGFELLPGQKVDAQVMGVALAYGAFGAFADALACVGGYCFGLTGDGGTIPVEVYLYIHGRDKYLIDKLWQGEASYSYSFSFELYCPGESVDGYNPPSNNHAILKVTPMGWNPLYYFIDMSNGLAPDVKFVYEKGQDPFGIRTIKSWVEFTDPTFFKDCGGQYVGEPIEDGAGNKDREEGGGGLLGWLQDRLAGVADFLRTVSFILIATAALIIVLVFMGLTRMASR